MFPALIFCDLEHIIIIFDTWRKTQKRGKGINIWYWVGELSQAQSDLKLSFHSFLSVPKARGFLYMTIKESSLNSTPSLQLTDRVVRNKISGSRLDMFFVQPKYCYIFFQAMVGRNLWPAEMYMKIVQTSCLQEKTFCSWVMMTRRGNFLLKPIFFHLFIE